MPGAHQGGKSVFSRKQVKYGDLSFFLSRVKLNNNVASVE